MRWFYFDSLVDFLGDIAMEDFRELLDLLLRFPSHWTSGSTTPPLLSQGNHQQSSILCLHRCPQLDNRSLSPSKLYSTMLILRHYIKNINRTRSMVEYDFEGRLRLSSWNIDEDDCWWFPWERRGGAVDDQRLIQKFSEMEIEEEDQEIQEVLPGACARKLI